jgi:hypothetical protein
MCVCVCVFVVAGSGGSTSFGAAWAENIFVAACLQRYATLRQKQLAAGGEGCPIAVADRHLKLSEFLEALVRIAYSRYDARGGGGAGDHLADKLERCLDDKFVPFAKHKGSQITSWFTQVCEQESLAFENPSVNN